VSEIVDVPQRGRRLKGLDEFEMPEFVGRMARLERRRRFLWSGMLSAAIVAGIAIGLLMF
jgi:hypothetical protein